MATLELLVPGPAPSAHRKITFASVDGKRTYTLPLLRTYGLDNLAANWVQTPRPGTWPLTTLAGQNLVQPRLEVVIGDGDLGTSAERDLSNLRLFAIDRNPLVVGALGKINTHSPTGSWVITEMTLDEVELVQGSNEIARAVVAITLTAAVTPEQVQASTVL